MKLPTLVGSLVQWSQLFRPENILRRGYTILVLTRSFLATSVALPMNGSRSGQGEATDFRTGYGFEVMMSVHRK